MLKQSAVFVAVFGIAFGLTLMIAVATTATP